MSNKQKADLETAEAAAKRLVEFLNPACERIEIAGSIRRKKAMVGDIEIVAIPKPEEGLFEKSYDGYRVQNYLLFGDKEPPAVYMLERPFFSKQGPWYCQFQFMGFTVDLFLATPEKWGCVYLIRTGSADFSRRMVTKRSQGGYCTDGFYFKDGRLWHGEEVIETAEEEDVFRALGLNWVEPEERI